MNVVNIIIISSSEKRLERFETTENNANPSISKIYKNTIWTRKLSITPLFRIESLYLKKDRRRNRQVKAGRWNNARKSTLLNPIYHFASCSISVEQKGREKIRARSKRGIRSSRWRARSWHVCPLKCKRIEGEGLEKNDGEGKEEKEEEEE